MSSIPVLYHDNGSFYSQRARLSFAEKDIVYKSHVVSLLLGEGYSPWFLRNVNPKGQVPALEHRGEILTDSKDIIEYVDTLPSDKPKLCPEGDSVEAVRVCYFRDLLESLNVPVMTYGSIYYREKLTVNCMVPSVMTRQRIESHVDRGSNKLLSVNQENPDLAPNKHAERSHFKHEFKDEALVMKVIGEFDKVLGEVEEELRKQKLTHGDEEYWLCSKTFTIADIYLCCLLQRLTFIGQAERLFLSNRPITTDYFKRVSKRKSFQKECIQAISFRSVICPIIWKKVKSARPYVLTLTLAAIGVYAYYKGDLISEFVREIIKIKPR